MNGPRLSVAMFFFNHAFVSSLIHSLDGPHRTTAVAYFWDLQQIPHTILSRIAPPSPHHCRKLAQCDNLNRLL